MIGRSVLFFMGLGITITFCLTSPMEPVLMLFGAALMGLPGFLDNEARWSSPVDRASRRKIFDYSVPTECNDGKLRKMKLSRDTDLREVHKLEDPINKQVQKDLKKLGMLPDPEIGHRSRGVSFQPKQWRDEGMRAHKNPPPPSYPYTEPPKTRYLAKGDMLKVTVGAQENCYLADVAGEYLVFQDGRVQGPNDMPEPIFEKILA